MSKEYISGHADSNHSRSQRISLSTITTSTQEHYNTSQYIDHSRNALHWESKKERHLDFRECKKERHLDFRKRKRDEELKGKERRMRSIPVQIVGMSYIWK